MTAKIRDFGTENHKKLEIFGICDSVCIFRNSLKLYLLDGQQRITAIWRSLNDKYEDYTVLVSLEDLSKPSIKVQRRTASKNGDSKLPIWAHSPDKCLQKNYIPIDILCPGIDGEQKKREWIKNATRENKDKFEQIYDQVSSLRERVATYHIPCLTLPSTVEKDTALDVFIRMNTSASPLKDFDIVVAQMEGSLERSLHDMIAELKDKVNDVRNFGKVEDIALSVGALLNGKPPLKKTYLDNDFGEELGKVWDRVVKGISRGIDFLQSESIFNDKLLPTEVITYLVSALWADLPDFGTDQEGKSRKLLRKVVWRACYTDRYLKTATTRAFADYKALKEMLHKQSIDEEPPLFDTEQNPLPSKSNLKRSGWPTRRDRLGRAILVTSLRDGGLDFASDEKTIDKVIPYREYHHIFPRALFETKFPDAVHSALNCALINWKTNRKISAKTPAEYMEERAKCANLFMDEVKNRLASHLIPFDELMAGDFEKFLDARAAIIHERMMKLANGID